MQINGSVCVASCSVTLSMLNDYSVKDMGRFTYNATLNGFLISDMDCESASTDV